METAEDCLLERFGEPGPSQVPSSLRVWGMEGDFFKSSVIWAKLDALARDFVAERDSRSRIVLPLKV